jgi:hypothetical protein
MATAAATCTLASLCAWRAQLYMQTFHLKLH